VLLALTQRYCEAFEDFRVACTNFFRNIDIDAVQRRRLSVENSEIIPD
jgi:hypothetical protein